MLQCPSSLKQVNFKTECFSSLPVTIDTEVIIFNIWPVVNNNETPGGGLQYETDGDARRLA